MDRMDRTSSTHKGNRNQIAILIWKIEQVEADVKHGKNWKYIILNRS
jgi:hypothetical protein